ncbi:type II toxin-antitoxin system RelE/ParE family toxin [Patescibacteria group bacterium]
MRVRNSYRAFYAYVQTKYIVILHIFGKKTQKTPTKEIRLAKRRLKGYE